jgi:hypothetical protein
MGASPLRENPMSAKSSSVKSPGVTAREERSIEEVEIRGHIIDSLILPKVLDQITTRGGSFRLKNIAIGQGRHDPSYALVEVQAHTAEQLREILDEIADHGAMPTALADCHLETADMEGAFPEGFYSSTNQRTEVRLDGAWIEVAQQEMDCGVIVDTAARTARCMPMCEVRRGQQVVVGHAGVRVFPPELTSERRGFEFMGSAVSTEKPKGVAIR